MPRNPSKLRVQVDKIYSASDHYVASLNALAESRSRVQIQIISQPIPKGDVEALAFLVMMEASRSAQEDLRAIMNQVKEINSAKLELRGIQENIKSQDLDFESAFLLLTVLYGKQLDQEIDSIQSRLDSLSEMGEMESLRLQMAMDRLSKLMSTLSNLLKKMSDTSGQIVQNMK